MYYIVFDLEWNQSSKKEYEVPELPFEIIEIGGVKLNSEGSMIGEFDELIKPKVYHEMHDITSKLIHIAMEELQRGKSFSEVASAFLDWSDEENRIFCTWGTLDLYELQRNMEYYKMTPMSDKPFAYLDIQKLFARVYGETRIRRSLEYAIDTLGIEKDIPFHRAFSDAYYTAKVLAKLLETNPEVFDYVSYDIYHAPADRKDEIKHQFDTYEKYISRVFEDKSKAFQDKEVSSCRCYICHRNLRKRVKWFSLNGRYYLCLAHCNEHGFFKGKNRIHRQGEGVFFVKTVKQITEEEAQDVIKKRDHMSEIRKKKRAE